jgi:glutamate synthase domain-containing protein 3
VVLGLHAEGEYRCRANFIGTGMHGGVIYIRGEVHPSQLGQEVEALPVADPEAEGIADLVREYCQHFRRDPKQILERPFIKIYPRYLRPYGRLYAY